ncbi:dephospho-CoA kinase [Amylibacter ulvae]|uniref:Dephospho-CoA kinase n=1 Tax=Paramylibacter ulvae TaxID=1651968 RepID=A0ABQ3CZN4_9RHOB|nr:dephospho-CoA kinase [Amylibacter ulvae]GHA48245.1 dephospho-CoA kinase [Amylibacter ulvae]
MSKLYVLGLTGSIGMGKTTTANMFRDAQIAVWDADAAVHELYTSHTDTIEKIAALAPIAVDGDGVNRDRLRNVLQADTSLFAKLEKIVHPAIRMHRDAFLDRCRELNLPLAVVDIPLLFEAGADEWVDGVLVVSTTVDEQRARVLKRGMDEKSFEMILSRQTPDAEKRERADFVIETNSLEQVQSDVHNLIEQLTKD